MQQRTVIYFILAIVVLLCSCGRRPRYVMHEDKMTDVLYDIQLAQAIYRSGSDFSNDEKKDALLNGILQKYNITQAELDSSLLWYSDNIEIYNTINDSVASRLRAASNVMTSSRSNVLGRGYSNYLVPPLSYLNEQTPTMSFDIDSNKIKTIDLPKFSLRFDVQGVNSLQNAEAAVFFTYKDTLVKTIVPIAENRRYIFSKPQLADSLLKNISGYVHVKNKIKGISSDVILYNISYIDSIADIKPASEEVSDTAPLAQPEDKPEITTATDTQIKPDLSNDKMVTPPPVTNSRNNDRKIDNLPVVSRDKVNRNPSVNRGRDLNSSKKEEGLK
ncbi:DUF4296 domain-containing protein [uncultured Dysgonomonas sp.]|uniref:DUF4296 domain-containing protein n=1 Tax=uncultured Dysgonomonas sp. TaxID=206096 RepID=A0A212K2E7_9BACT|nr:DUF4296 domain-containing protein [uncultured Dysgonomonas sp.]SBW05881.1 conserved hypothetical protein [uncultured Dysgonomonas sp.]